MKKQLNESLSAKPVSRKAISVKAISIEKRLAGYGVMSLAIAAGAAPNAAAGVVYWDPDATTPVGGGIYFNVISGNTTLASSDSLEPGAVAGEFALENMVGSRGFLQAFLVGSANNEFAVAPAASWNGPSPYPTSAARLARNATIGSALSFNNPKTLFSSGGSPYPNNVFPSLAANALELGQWNALGSGYLGLTFQDGSQTDYGWAQITINPDYTVTLDAVGYDDSGNSIPAGETPEPNSMLLMALGASGLEVYRRRMASKPRKTRCSQPPEPHRNDVASQPRSAICSSGCSIVTQGRRNQATGSHGPNRSSTRKNYVTRLSQ
jgi:PEP-CTERM motif-containing protein